MKKRLFLGFALMLAIMTASPAFADPITYEGTLTLDNWVTGTTTGDSWVDEIGSEVGFWNFQGTEGSTVHLVGLRLDGELDLAFSLYSGLTTADEGAFLNTSDFGGLTWLAAADDELPPYLPGPYGDPALVYFTLPATGWYTVAVGGFASDGEGPYGYELAMVSDPPDINNVPVPAAVWLLGSGLLGLLGLKRKFSA